MLHALAEASRAPRRGATRAGRYFVWLELGEGVDSAARRAGRRRRGAPRPRRGLLPAGSGRGGSSSGSRSASSRPSGSPKGSRGSLRSRQARGFLDRAAPRAQLVEEVAGSEADPDAEQDEDEQRDLAEKKTKLTSTCFRLKRTMRTASRRARRRRSASRASPAAPRAVARAAATRSCGDPMPRGRRRPAAAAAARAAAAAGRQRPGGREHGTSGRGRCPASAQSPSRRKKQSSQVTCERLFAIFSEVAPRRPARILSRAWLPEQPPTRRIGRNLRVFSEQRAWKSAFRRVRCQLPQRLLKTLHRDGARRMLAGDLAAFCPLGTGRHPHPTGAPVRLLLDGSDRDDRAIGRECARRGDPAPVRHVAAQLAGDLEHDRPEQASDPGRDRCPRRRAARCPPPGRPGCRRSGLSGSPWFGTVATVSSTALAADLVSATSSPGVRRPIHL